ncbi:hypothetical protein ABN034_23880 [Actinopolymorpha sp. B11F2]|uniref:hypothetical protein n=1 Tax=Actinopolymorpha sp. B11F2 TaxID=3160862 RepID=UPI0032E51275
MATRLGIVGAVLFGVGLIAGFVPFTSYGYDCGSAFVPSSYEREYARVNDARVNGLADRQPGGAIRIVDPPASQCDELRWLVRIPAVGLVGAGGIVLARRWYVATQSAGRARTGGLPTTPA